MTFLTAFSFVSGNSLLIARSLLLLCYLSLMRISGVVLSAPSYKSADPASNPGQVARSLPSCSSFLFGVLDRMGTRGNLEKADCGNLVITPATRPEVMGSFPLQAPGHRDRDERQGQVQL